MNRFSNLVPVPFQRRLLLRRRLRQWSIVWMLCGLAIGSAAIGEYSHVARLRSTLETQQKKCEPLRKIEQATDIARQQLADLCQRTAFLSSLQRSDRPAQLMGFVGQAACRPTQLIHIGECELTTTGIPAMSQADSLPQGIAGRTLLLKGIGVDDLAVARFVSDLREMRLFDEVTLNSSMDTPISDGYERQFEVTCEYR